MKQKLIALLISAAFAICILPTAVFADDEGLVFQFEEITNVVHSGEELELKIKATQNKGFVSGHVEIEWDNKNLELIDVIYSSIAPYNGSKTVSNDGKYTIAFGNDTASSDNKNTGLFFTLKMKVKESAQSGEYTVSLKESDSGITNCELEPVSVGKSSVTFNVKGMLLGDINENGKINIVDAQIAYDISNGKYDSDPDINKMKALADVNKDSTVTSADARAIQYYVHYKTFEVAGN